MKKIIFVFTLAAALMGTAAMAQQPEHNHQNCPHHNQQKVDQPRPDQAPQAVSCQSLPGDKECCHKEQSCQHQCQHHEGHCNHDAFRPHGQAIVTLFEHFGATNTADGWTQNGFQMERAYFGYKYMFDPHWTATVIFDASEAATNGIEHVFVKNANVQYKNHRFTAIAGIINSSQAVLAEKYWGLRYVARSMYDLYGYGNTADLGFNLKYDIAPWLSADFSMLNGEGFRKIQLDNHYLYGLGLNISPIEHFDIRIYGDIQTHDTNALSVSRGTLADTAVNPVARKNVHFFAGYDHRYFRIGAEYNMRFACNYLPGDNATGLSVYAVGKINPKLNLFCRYDRGVSSDNDLLSTAFQYANDGQNIFAGVDYRINKLVAVSPAIQYHITPAGATSLYAYLSCKVNL